MEIFLPGRLCLFGEHSDWAGTYRSINPKIGQGSALIVGTNQGIYARVKQHSQDLIFQASFPDGSKSERIKLPMTREGLLQEVQKGEFFSYIAGTAYEILNNYQVKGLEIENYLTDLPIKKGLSSSAAICVLIARAFNKIYNLHLSIKEEMEIAYLGERMTPSLCGRMDQAGAFGNKPIKMTFDGEQVELEELTVKQELYLVIVDLGGKKDTTTILRELNKCYPFARNEIQQNVQEYLGVTNSQFIEKAVVAISQGDAQSLGTLMNQVQVEFDRYLIPACPEQLTAPKLHQLLEARELQPFIYGGKGVGSQGDGTAQLVARNRESQEQGISIIHRNFPQMQAFKLTISPTARD